MVQGTELFTVVDTGTDDPWIVLRCYDTTNDPRVSGTSTDTWSVDFYSEKGRPPTVGIDWGWRRLVNEGGSWEGPIVGVVFPGPRDEITFWLTGSGDYEGLTYYMHIGAVAGPTPEGAVYPIEGIIFRGSPPSPVPGPPIGTP